MTDVKDLYRYPDDVDAYGFDWGQLSVTLGPQVNGAARFSAAVVTVGLYFLGTFSNKS